MLPCCFTIFEIHFHLDTTDMAMDISKENVTFETGSITQTIYNTKSPIQWDGTHLLCGENGESVYIPG